MGSLRCCLRSPIPTPPNATDADSSVKFADALEPETLTVALGCNLQHCSIACSYHQEH